MELNLAQENLMAYLGLPVPGRPAAKVASLASPAARSNLAKRAVDQGTLGAAVAGSILKRGLGELGPEVADELLSRLVSEQKPTSIVERMAIEMLVVSYAQFMDVNRQIAALQRLDQVEKLVAVASRLQGDLRRTMVTLRDWRLPVKSVIVTNQANIAHQQFVQQAVVPNELGNKGG